MIEQRAIWLLSQMYLPCFEEEEKQAITKAIESLEAMKMLSNTVTELKDKLKFYLAMEHESEDEYYQNKFSTMADVMGECIGKIEKIYK